MLPVEGKTYVDIRGMKRYVVKIDSTHVYYYLGHSKGVLRHKTLDSFRMTCMGNTNKPLDEAFKQLDKQLCSHRNIREDRFFSAMVYRTCKDCGKPLN